MSKIFIIGKSGGCKPAGLCDMAVFLKDSEALSSEELL